MAEYKYAGYITRAKAVELLERYDFTYPENTFWKDCALDEQFKMFKAGNLIMLLNSFNLVSCTLVRKGIETTLGEWLKRAERFDKTLCEELRYACNGNFYEDEFTPLQLQRCLICWFDEAAPKSGLCNETFEQRWDKEMIGIYNKFEEFINLYQ